MTKQELARYFFARIEARLAAQGLTVHKIPKGNPFGISRRTVYNLSQGIVSDKIIARLEECLQVRVEYIVEDQKQT